MTKLSPEEFKAFRNWFADYGMTRWDTQTGRGSATGELDRLMEDDRAGRTTEIESSGFGGPDSRRISLVLDWSSRRIRSENKLNRIVSGQRYRLICRATFAGQLLFNGLSIRYDDEKG